MTAAAGNGPLGSAAAAALALAALVVLPPAPAPAQPRGPAFCPERLAGQVGGGLPFAYGSFRGRVAGQPSIVHCVRNLHGRRPLYVDWEPAGLVGWIEPLGGDGAANPLFGARPPVVGSGVIRYGARRRALRVSTLRLGAHAPRPPALAASPFAWRPRLAAQAPDGSDKWTMTGGLQIPAADIANRFLGAEAGKSGKSGKLRRRLAALALARLIRFVEDRPEALVRFEMSFTTTHRPSADGVARMHYSCTYRDPIASPPALAFAPAGALFLRFEDPALHRAMFRSPAPFRLGGWAGRTHSMVGGAAGSEAGPAEPRSTRLQILLGDGETVLASVPVTYLAPAAALAPQA